MTSDHNSSELGIHDHSNEQSSSKLFPKVVPQADKTATSRKRVGITISPLHNDAEGRMPTKIELTLEQSQGVSNDVLVSIEGVEELKRNVWIKGNELGKRLNQKDSKLSYSLLTVLSALRRFLQVVQDECKVLLEHVGQGTEIEGGQRRSRRKDKDLKISNVKTKSKDNDKG
ncbi:hypothetical protein Tco_0570699 [Tanacetum coccineum]